MWRPYVDLAQTFFPNAKIIIDKYHFIRQITWAIENVRKRLQKSMPASLRKYYKRSHKLILSRYQSLSTENKQACDLMLLYSDELRFAHSMKEWFYDICHMRSYRKQQLESEISTDSEPGFFIVHHKIKWSVTWRLIWHA